MEIRNLNVVSIVFVFLFVMLTLVVVDVLFIVEKPNQGIGV